jgi:hypothetical protein
LCKSPSSPLGSHHVEERRVKCSTSEAWTELRCCCCCCCREIGDEAILRMECEEELEEHATGVILEQGALPYCDREGAASEGSFSRDVEAAEVLIISVAVAVKVGSGFDMSTTLNRTVLYGKLTAGRIGTAAGPRLSGCFHGGETPPAPTTSLPRIGLSFLPSLRSHCTIPIGISRSDLSLILEDTSSPHHLVLSCHTRHGVRPRLGR